MHAPSNHPSKARSFRAGVLIVCLAVAACRGSTQRAPTPVPSSTVAVEQRTPTRTPTPTPAATQPPSATDTSAAEPVPEPTITPEPTDVPVQIEDLTGRNLLLNGRLQDANGNPNFTGWEQDPAYWCDWQINTRNCGLHGPLPQSPSQTWSLQADRDYKNSDTWPAGCCPAARAWTIASNVPPHNRLFFGWEEIHHLNGSVMELRVYGIESNGSLVEIFLQVGPRSPVIKTKQDPVGVFLVEIPIPEGGYGAYQVEVYVRLEGEFDGVLIGDFKLIAEP